MAIFRKINVSFWDDEKVVDDFTPEDRYFMLYLMTNPHTNQVGCYQITLRQIEFETGYNKETVLKLISRFEKVLKVIKYSESTKELLILNWHKYNWTNSPKILACLSKEYKSIKNREFRYYINRVSIQYGYGIDTESQEEQEQEQEKEQEEFKEEEVEEEATTSPPDNFVSDLSDWYGECVNVHLTPTHYSKLLNEILSENALKELIDELSLNIARGKAPPYDESQPDCHYAQLKVYWKNKKLKSTNPVSSFDRAKAFKEELDKLTEQYRLKEAESG